MKNFGSILMVLAAGASFVAAMPAPGAQSHGIEARGQPYYALHVREPKHGKKDKNKGNNNNNGNAGNATVAATPANNGTADANNGNDNGNGKKHGKDNGNNDNGNAQAQADGQGNAADANSILDSLIGLLGGNAAAGQQGAAAGQAGQDPLAILQGLLNNA
ncbi:hypothetical protein F5Y09DRAFT_280873 [Xylaria sp. FL1042]|nr:hypothetical protein F5Y09DRAFT_280873 [Xylaria sp. FL1042]